MKFPLNWAGPAPGSPNWHPWPIRKPFLGVFIVLCILLLVAIELVVQGCSQSGCHVFGASSSESISNATNWAYNLLPTALTLGLSLLWAVPHHDIIRLEPYFQMSVPGGATAENSILLEYSYTLPFLLPIIAGRRRHYIVSLSACILLLMNFVVIPLISGIFEDSTLQLPWYGPATQKQLHPLVNREYELTAGFTYLAYNYAWRDNTLPPFTTEEYALLPVVNMTQMDQSEMWITDTTIYGAKLRCDNASVDIRNTDERGVSIKISTVNGNYTVSLCDRRVKVQDKAQDNTSGCDLYTTFLTPWTSIAHQISDAAWGRDNSASSRAEQTYMFAWASGANPDWDLNPKTSPTPRNLTALFCTTSYYSQAAEVNFTMPSGAVGSVDPYGPATPFTGIDNFEKAVDGSFRPQLPERYKSSDNTVVGLGYAPQQLPNVDAQLYTRYGRRPEEVQYLITPVADMSTPNESNSSIYMDNVYGLSWYVLANMTAGTLDNLLEPANLMKEYEIALKQWFAFALSIEIVEEGLHSRESHTVNRYRHAKGFTVAKMWARGAEAGVVAAILIATVLAVMIGRRTCNLDGEPNTLAAALRLLQASPNLCSVMEGSEYRTPAQIKAILEKGNRRFTLELVPEQGPEVTVTLGQGETVAPGQRETVTPGQGETVTPGQGGTTPHADSGNKAYSEEQPMLRSGMGVVLLVLVGGVTALLTVVYVYSILWSGIPTVAPLNSFWYKVLFTYLPTAVSLGFEPMLTTIASYHCMLGPYQTLDKGGAPCSTSLLIDYDKSPPHFQLLRSIRQGNFPLAALTTALLLSHVLAVAFAGLFSAKSVELTGNSTYGVIYPTFGFTGPIEGRSLEMYYILADNLARDLPLPPLVTEEYFVLDFEAWDPSGDIEKYSGPSHGVGINVTCNLVTSDSIHLACDPSTDVNLPSAVYCPENYYITVSDPCWAHVTPSNNISLTQDFTNTSGDFFLQSANCLNTFFAMWLQRPADPHPPNVTSLYLHYLDTVLLKCETVEKIVALNATATPDDVILDINVTRQLSAQEVLGMYPAYTKPRDRLPHRFIESIRQGLLAEDEVNDADDIRWFNYLTATIDPSIVRNTTNITHIPDTAHLVAAFEDVYRRLFAITIGLNSDLLNYGDGVQVTLPCVVHIDKVLVSGLMYKIAAAILFFIMAVLVLLYWGNRGGRFEGHLPRSLAMMYSLLYASNAQDECGSVKGMDPEERAKELRNLGYRYRFGEFVNGGRPHIGIHREGPIASSGESPNKPG